MDNSVWAVNDLREEGTLVKRSAEGCSTDLHSGVRANLQKRVTRVQALESCLLLLLESSAMP
jgi:hypothetical protein